MKQFPRITLTCTSIAVLTMSSLVSATAAGSNSGYKSCAPSYVGATSDGTLYVTATPPGNTATVYNVRRHTVTVPGASTSGNWLTKATGTYNGGYAWRGSGI